MRWNSKYPVHLQPEDVNFWVIDGELSPVCDDFLSKMSAQKMNFWKEQLCRQYALVNQTSRGKFGLETMSKDLGESSLMMVEELL